MPRIGEPRWREAGGKFRALSACGVKVAGGCGPRVVGVCGLRVIDGCGDVKVVEWSHAHNIIDEPSPSKGLTRLVTHYNRAAMAKNTFQV